MSRQLPARPNLEYLKKQAKDLLDDLRRSDPSAQLADAQFALSREYGFDSWPKLKAHVESQIAVRPDSPLAGGWIADVAQSTHHPANPFRTARIHFTVNGTSVDIVDEFVDESGKAVRGRNHLDADGIERDAGNGYSISASLTPDGLRAMTRKDGEVTAVTYAVSAGNRILTISGGPSTIVLNRLIQ